MKAFSYLIFLCISHTLVAQNQTLTADSSTTRALVVGISDYQDSNIPDLQYAHRDAELFAKYLASDKGGQVPKDNIMLLTDSMATFSKLAVTLDYLFDVSERGDKVILYFSCYADVERKSISQPGYLLCWDAPSTIYVAGGTFPIFYIKEIISTLEQNGVQVIVISDINRPGKLAGSGIHGPQLAAASLSIQFANEVKIIACQPNEHSLEGAEWGGGHGVFSYFLVQGLWGAADRDKDGAITLREIGRYLEDKVSEETVPHSQTPFTSGDRSTVLFSVTDDSGVFPEELLNIDTGFREVHGNQVDANTIKDAEAPRFNIVAPGICNGQAFVTDSDSFEIQLGIENKVDYVLVNQEKRVDVSPDTLQFTVPLEAGLNLIKVSALNKLKSKADSIYVFSKHQYRRRSRAYKMNHYALFIATDIYKEEKFSSLNNPIYDAKAVAGELEKNYGFETDTLLNPTKTEILTKLQEYAIRFNSQGYEKRSDHLLIYISGHGTWDPNFKQGHLVAHDSKANDPIFESYISYADLQNKIDNLGCKHILVVMDACYGGTFDLALAANSKRSVSPYSAPDQTTFINEKLRYKTRRLLAAGRDVPVYDGYENEHSPFTWQFLEALRNPSEEQVITIQGLQEYLDKSDPVPHTSVFGSNAPGSNFLFLYNWLD